MLAKLGVAVREEWFLAVSIAAAALFQGLGHVMSVRAPAPLALPIIFLWLFGAALGSCLAVVRHASHLATRLGEPFGTLILTIVVTTVEVVSLSAMWTQNHHEITQLRDTIFALIMILLNGMVGLCLLLGGWRHLEQPYNLQGANAYLTVILPLTVLSLILPNFISIGLGAALSPMQQGFVGCVSVGLYLAFLGLQALRHRHHFSFGEPDDGETGHGTSSVGSRHAAVHATLLVIYMLPLVFLAEQLAKPIDTIIETMHVPVALGGVVIAVLVATPEAVSAVRAARANQMQRAMNIFLGSVLATVGLTIPAMMLVSGLNGEPIVLGLQSGPGILLLLTLAVNMLTFSGGRTNVLQGIVHLVLFATYIMLIFDA